MMKKSSVLPGFALSVVMLLLSAPLIPLMGQETIELAPEALFEPGIDVIDVEYQPPVTYPTRVPTPAHTPEPRCGFVPYLQIGETAEWQIDYEEAPTFTMQPFDIPLILCSRLTGERRDIQVAEPVQSVSVSPDERYAVLLGIGRYFGYDFHTDRLITLSQPDDRAIYDSRGVTRNVFADFCGRVLELQMQINDDGQIKRSMLPAAGPQHLHDRRCG